MKKMMYRPIPEINAGSMADIAFLLLIFFLVSTTIVKKKIIPITLPYPYEGDPGQIADRNVLSILVNNKDELLVENEEVPITVLSNLVKEFVENPHKIQSYASTPENAVILFKNHIDASYEVYAKVYAIIVNAYKEMRNEHSLKKYNLTYDLLSNSQKNEIIAMLPMKVAESEISIP